MQLPSEGHRPHPPEGVWGALLLDGSQALVQLCGHRPRLPRLRELPLLPLCARQAAVSRLSGVKVLIGNGAQ